MRWKLWHGQHGLYGGQPSAPGNVSQQEAIVAVTIAVGLVVGDARSRFSKGHVKRTVDA